MRDEIRSYMQDLKDKGIKARMYDEQLNEFLNKIFEGIKIASQKKVGLKTINLEEILKNVKINKFFEEYNEKPLSMYYTDKNGTHNIDTYDIHNNFNDYVAKKLVEINF